MNHVWVVLNAFDEVCEGLFTDEEEAETYAKNASEESEGDRYTVVTYVRDRSKSFGE